MEEISAAGLVGLFFFNLFAAAGIWTVLGIAVERIGNLFNETMQVMPTFQDAVNGFSLMQVVWSAIMVIIFLGLIINYLMNESNQIPGEQ